MRSSGCYCRWWSGLRGVICSIEWEPFKAGTRESPYGGCAQPLCLAHKTTQIVKYLLEKQIMKKIKQPRGTQVGGWVPEALGHTLISLFFSRSQNTPALFQPLSKVPFYKSKCLLQHSSSDSFPSALFSSDFKAFLSLSSWNGSKERSLDFLPGQP